MNPERLQQQMQSIANQHQSKKAQRERKAIERHAASIISAIKKHQGRHFKLDIDENINGEHFEEIGKALTGNEKIESLSISI